MPTANGERIVDRAVSPSVDEPARSEVRTMMMHTLLPDALHSDVREIVHQDERDRIRRSHDAHTNGERIVDRAVSPLVDEPARSEVRTMMIHTLLPDALHSDVREIVHQDERDRIRRSHDAHTNGERIVDHAVSPLVDEPARSEVRTMMMHTLLPDALHPDARKIVHQDERDHIWRSHDAYTNAERIVDRAVSPSMDEPARSEVRTMMMHTLLPDASNPDSREIVHQDERDRIRRSHDAYTNGERIVDRAVSPSMDELARSEVRTMMMHTLLPDALHSDVREIVHQDERDRIWRSHDAHTNGERIVDRAVSPSVDEPARSEVRTMMIHTLLPDALHSDVREIVHQDERDRIRRSHDAYTNGERIVDRAVSPSMDEPDRSEVRTMMMHTLLPDALHSDVREIVHQDERDHIWRSHDAHTNGERIVDRAVSPSVDEPARSEVRTMMMHTLLPDALHPDVGEIVHQDERDRIRRSHDAYTNGERIVDRAVSPSVDEPARSEVRTMMMHTLLPDALHSDAREIVHQDERDHIWRSHDAYTNAERIVDRAVSPSMDEPA